MKNFKELIESEQSSEEIVQAVINEKEIPIDDVQVGDTVSIPLRMTKNYKLDYHVFQVDSIERKQGSRGEEIILRGKDRNHFLVRDSGEPVELH